MRWKIYRWHRNILWNKANIFKYKSLKPFHTVKEACCLKKKLLRSVSSTNTDFPWLFISCSFLVVGLKWAFKLENICRLLTIIFQTRRKVVQAGYAMKYSQTAAAHGTRIPGKTITFHYLIRAPSTCHIRASTYHFAQKFITGK